MISIALQTPNTNISNIETQNVKQIPNPQNSRLLSDMINENFLTDYYRKLHPTTKTYSHIPYNKKDSSRTRIDFWLGSENLLELIKDIKYLDRTSKLHDHKPVLLNFKIANQNNKTYIDPTLLDIPGLQQTVTLATLHTFTDYITSKNIYPQFITDMQINLLSARTSYATIRNLIELSIPTHTTN